MINLDEIEARANAATPGPWEPLTVRNVAGVRAPNLSCYVYLNEGRGDTHPDTVKRWHSDTAFIAAARTDVPALIARVRELEAERDSYARSHLILKAIHGALTDALPNTPIPALDSFDVVELVRALANGVKP